jgi:hypothetical protein
VSAVLGESDVISVCTDVLGGISAVLGEFDDEEDLLQADSESNNEVVNKTAVYFFI